MDLPEPPRRDLAEPEVPPNKTGPALSAVGGGLVLAGSLMPWASVATIFGSISVAGTEGDGVITLGLGIAVLLLAVVELAGTSRTRGIVTVVSAITGALAVFEIVNVSSRIGEASSTAVRASVGIGLWMVVVGAVLAFAGSRVQR